MGLIADQFARYANRESKSSWFHVENNKIANMNSELRTVRKQWIETIDHPQLVSVISDKHGNFHLCLQIQRSYHFQSSGDNVFQPDEPTWGKIYKIARMCDDVGVMTVEECLSVIDTVYTHHHWASGPGVSCKPGPCSPVIVKYESNTNRPLASSFVWTHQWENHLKMSPVNIGILAGRVKSSETCLRCGWMRDRFDKQ